MLYIYLDFFESELFALSPFLFPTSRFVSIIPAFLCCLQVLCSYLLYTTWSFVYVTFRLHHVPLS